MKQGRRDKFKILRLNGMKDRYFIAFEMIHSRVNNIHLSRINYLFLKNTYSILIFLYFNTVKIYKKS